MGIIIRGMGNVLRNPVRLILVVVLLGASLMFVASMISLNQSAQQQLENVHKEVGTAITINYASNDARQFGGDSSNTNNGTTGNPGAPAPGRAGGTGPTGNGGGFGQVAATPIPDSVVKQVASISGVVSTEETVRQSDTDGKLTTSAINTPNGQTITIPPTVYGISNGATHFTLGRGSVPTMVAGHGFQDSDVNAHVAMMNQTLATTNKLNVGSTFTLKGTTITLVGLYTTTDQFSSNTIVLPLKTAQSIYSVAGVDSITAYAASYEQVGPVATKLKSVLGTKYDVVTQDTLYANTFSSLNVAQSSISLALIVSIAVAVIVIVFTVLIIVRERTTEIGTLKALGASHWQVISQFWGEILAMSGLGAILAIVLIAAIGPVISRGFDLSTATSAFGRTGGPGRFGGGRGLFAQSVQNVHLTAATLNIQTLLIIVGLGMGLAILTSMIPAWYVARIKPAVVLRKGN
jgi:putative ABC transport system permease protein